MLAIVLAALIQNLSEWFAHKYLLHGLGTKKDSFFHYHWEHHHRCRKNGNEDQEYVEFFSGDISRMLTKEVGFMVLLSLVVPLGFWNVWPAFSIATLFFLWLYFFAHAYSHVNVELGKRLMPWHYDHHQGIDQNTNWCVTFPWADWLLGTRVGISYKPNKDIGRPCP